MSLWKIVCAFALFALVACTKDVPTPILLAAATPTQADSATATPVPPSAPSITATAIAPTRDRTETIQSQPTPPISAEIVSFTVSPTTTVALGQNLSITWEARSEQAEICGIIEVGPIDCRTVPSSGTLTYTTSSSSVVYYALALRATTRGKAAISIIPVKLCADATQWFFTDAPARCPQPANNSRAAAQYFEHGTMVWLAKPDKLFALYAGSEQTIEMLSTPYNFKAEASASNRVGGAPGGLLEPINGFGQLWRGEFVGPSLSVRQRLGWATAPEFNFDAAYQCLIAGTRLWSCFLRDPRGAVLWLRPDSTAQANLVWSVILTK